MCKQGIARLVSHEHGRKVIEVLAFMAIAPNSLTRSTGAMLIVMQNFGKDKMGTHIAIPAEDAEYIVEDLEDEAEVLRSEGSVVRFISRLNSLI